MPQNGLQLDASTPAVHERWGFGDLGWVLLAILAFGIGAVGVTEGFGLDQESTLADAIYAVALLLPLTVVPMLVARRKGSGWRSAYSFAVSRRSVVVGTIAGAVALVVVGLALWIVEQVQGNGATANTSEDLASATGAGFVALLLLSALWAPFAEEITFRGLLWGAAAKRGWSPRVATLIAALPFAAVHLEPARFIPLLVSGLILGAARQRGGLASAVLAHLIVNGAAAVATVISVI
jgi:hypothetical protein